MVQNDIHISSGKFGSALAVQVRTGYRSNRIAKIGSDGALYIELSVNDQTSTINTALIDYLAKLLSVNHKQIEIVAGEDKPKKLVSIIDISPDEVQKIIDQYIRS